MFYLFFLLWGVMYSASIQYQYLLHNYRGQSNWEYKGQFEAKDSVTNQMYFVCCVFANRPAQKSCLSKSKAIMLQYYVGISESSLIEVVLASVVSDNTCTYISKYKVFSDHHNQCFGFYKSYCHQNKL